MRKFLLMLIVLVCLLILGTSCHIGDEANNCRGICYGCWYADRDEEIANKDPEKSTSLESNDYEIVNVEAIPSTDADYFNRQCIRLYGAIKFHKAATNVTIVINVMLGDSIISQYKETLQEVSPGYVYNVNKQLAYNVYYESGDLECLVEIRGRKGVE